MSLEFRMDTIGGMPGPWLWPSSDRELWEVRHLVSDLDLALRYCHRRGVAIQAGGACGVWPRYLASHFDQVYTFEPAPDNFACLVYNTLGRPNVWPFRHGLGKLGQGRRLANAKPDNAGTCKTIPQTGPCPILPIDLYYINPVDLIVLDIEGGEHDALLGATNTIENDHPVIMIENNGLGESCEALLTEWGYELREQAHRDEIWTYQNPT